MGVAPIFFLSPVVVWEVEGVHSFRGAVPPLAVVAGHLPVGVGREAVHCVGTPQLVEVPEDARSQLPVGVVGHSRKVVGHTFAALRM